MKGHFSFMEVMTTDGYLLALQRIPGPRWSSKAAADASNAAADATKVSAEASEASSDAKSKPVLFLMHGLLGSATNWIANLPNQSLAFMAADAGQCTLI